MPTKKICMVLFLGGLISCGNPTDKNSSKSQVTTSGNTNEKVDLDGDVEIEEVAEVFFSKKQISGITYTAQLLSGNEFYSATNPTNSSKENKKLNAESVVILEFSMEKSRKKIWDQQTLRMDKTQAEQYLMGDVSKDISYKVGGQSYLPSGVHYEAGFGSASKIRLYVFLGEVRKEEVHQFMYYDNLFGAGMLRFPFTNKSN